MDGRPNILLILTDQERFDVSAPNGPPVQTPNIDRIRREGLTFTNAYTPIGLCTSARSSLLSGLYPHSHGMLNNCHESDAIQSNLPKDLTTFGVLLDDAGYTNTYAGKWHVGRDQGPEDFGFRFLGGGDGHHDSPDPNFFEHQRDFGVTPGEIPIEDAVYTANPDASLISGKTTIPKEATRSYYIANKTIEQLQSWSSNGGPYFHRTDFLGPHHPYVVPEPYASMYDPEDITLWSNFSDPYEEKPRIHEQYLSYRGVAELSEAEWREVIAKYFGFVTFIDEQIGRILRAADETRLEVATFRGSDHGDFTGSHRQFNKGPMMYEEVYHIPLQLHWPGVVGPDERCTEFVRLLDLMPTFLDMAEVSPPDGIHGRSVLPLLDGKAPEDWPQSVFAEFHGDEFGLYSQRMIRTDRYKYIYNVPDIDELYDLEEDPDELMNLVDDERYQEVKTDLRERLYGWMDRTGDGIEEWSRKNLVGPPSS